MVSFGMCEPFRLARNLNATVNRSGGLLPHAYEFKTGAAKACLSAKS